jgi:hypothetical protein
MKPLWLITALAGFVSTSVLAAPITVKFDKVADNVYAFVGPTDDRTIDNLGLNSNHGLVVTDKGAILIDSGASFTAAKALEKAAAQVTKQPIVAVINTGSQDHRWLGNGYFAGKAALDMGSIDEVSAKSKDLPQFKHLKHYESWNPRNVNSTFLFYEQGN